MSLVSACSSIGCQAEAFETWQRYGLSSFRLPNENDSHNHLHSQYDFHVQMHLILIWKCGIIVFQRLTNGKVCVRRARFINTDMSDRTRGNPRFLKLAKCEPCPYDYKCPVCAGHGGQDGSQA